MCVKTLLSCVFCYYNKHMQYEWDETKRQINIEKHAFDFVDMEFQHEKQN